MKTALRIVVSIDRQHLSLFRGRRLLKTYPVSTAKRGTGFEPGSYRTPTGRFIIRELIGDGQPSGTIFVARRPVGIWSPAQESDKDLVLTRILRLDGLDPDNSNSWDRYIYIHGTNQEHLIGSPASMGCVRMSNRDIIDLFSLIKVNTPVEIVSKHQPDILDTGAPLDVMTGNTNRKDGLTLNTKEQTLYVTSSSDPHYAAAVMATKKDTKKGKRYTPQEKETILAFVAEVNSKNKRGGQKAAAEKFDISPLTIANWLKATKKTANKPVTKKVSKKKAAKPGRPAKKKTAKKKTAKKKTAKKKTAKRGRPVKRGRPAKKKTAKRGRPAAGGFSAKLRKLADHNDQIAKAEAVLSKLKAEFTKLKASL